MNLTTRRWLGGLLVAVAILTSAGSGRGAEQTVQPSEAALWTNRVGNGFQSGTQTLTFEAGGVHGLEILGSVQFHNLALASLSYGRMTGPVMGEDRWYQGNWELRAELFGGTQFSPSEAWIIGLTPHLRYDFATGSRWIPFVDAGAGATATDIGRPDLSCTFEFNVQGGVGVHWFVRDDWAVTAEARYFHVSDAGLTRPNYGVNGVMGMIGLTWFF